MCLQTTGWEENSVDTDQTPHVMLARQSVSWLSIRQYVGWSTDWSIN